MNILSAIYAGQTGFLKATQSLAERAQRIAVAAPASETLAEDLVGMGIDRSVAEANLKTTKISSELMTEFIQQTLKK